MNKAISAHSAFIENYHPSLNTTKMVKQSYDILEPVWNCETAERVPRTSGDGPKWMCGTDILGIVPKPVGKPLFYSFGSNGDASWEIANM